MSRPLDGVRVLDLGRFVAAPHCAMILADLGASVIKVERPGRGDDSRSIPPFVDGESLYYAVLNRNKGSIALDLKSSYGREQARRLISVADVVIENFIPGALDRLGLGWESLHALNPRLILASVTAFDADSSWASRPGFDAMAQAGSGMMTVTGPPEGPPTLAGVYVVDFSASLYLTIAILAALRHRDVTGVGQRVSTSLHQSALSLLGTAIAEVSAGGTARRTGNSDPFIAPAGAFITREGRWVQLSAGTDEHFPRLTAAMNAPDLLAPDRGFASVHDRMRNRAELDRIVADWIRSQSVEEVTRALEGAGIVHCVIRTVEEVIDLARDGIAGKMLSIEVAGHPVVIPGNPITMPDAEAGPLVPPPPLNNTEPTHVIDEWTSQRSREGQS